MKVDVKFDDGIGLIDIPSLSNWFTNEKIIPNIGEHLFVNDNCEDQAKVAGSYEWKVVGKYFDPHMNEVTIRFNDVNNII